MSDYAALALAVSPFVLGPLGVMLYLSGQPWAMGLITYSLVVAYSASRLLMGIARHGIHNDR